MKSGCGDRTEEMTAYSKAPAMVTECHRCGETVMCDVVIADSPDPETGYVDEYAECEECRNNARRKYLNV
jgi:hypothetical protein